jgi:hypothetical protein
MSFDKKIPSIYSLKKLAKCLVQDHNISLSNAQDRIANQYGFTHWSLLIKHFNSYSINKIDSLWKSLKPSQMMMISAKQNAGKMTLALNLATLALKEGVKVNYYSMQFEKKMIVERLCLIDECTQQWLAGNHLSINDSIKSDKPIVDAVTNCAHNSLVIIDNLQVLPRESQTKVLAKLNRLGLQKNLKMIVLSQIGDRKASRYLDYIDGGRILSRHFSHVLHLESTAECTRKAILLKSTHYQKQQAIFSMDKKSYRFS